MAFQRKTFIAGATKNEIPQEDSAFIFDLMEKFAGYGFNKAHSAAYALISFQTAYLKANYPLAFMSALLTLDVGNIDKVSNIISEIKRIAAPRHNSLWLLSLLSVLFIPQSCCAIFVKKFNVVEIGERISDQIDRNNRHISEISNIFFNTKNV